MAREFSGKSWLGVADAIRTCADLNGAESTAFDQNPMERLAPTA
jgi:hypothetical protein